MVATYAGIGTQIVPSACITHSDLVRHLAHVSSCFSLTYGAIGLYIYTVFLEKFSLVNEGSQATRSYNQQVESRKQQVA